MILYEIHSQYSIIKYNLLIISGIKETNIFFHYFVKAE